MLTAVLASAVGMGWIAPVSKVVVGYVQKWNEMDTIRRTFDGSKVSHLNVAFENPVDDAGTMSFDPKDQEILDMAHGQKTKVLVSIGGGFASTDPILSGRYKTLLAADHRTAFAAKLADYVALHKFDGLDLDLEGPAITADYGPFVEELAKTLKAKKKLLTAAVSQGYGGESIPSSCLARFDLVNVMSYDATGPWDKSRPGQHSSMELAKQNVEYWLKRGVDREKMVLGVPFYGYGFGDAFLDDGYTFADIVSKYPGAENLDQVGNTIWYNGIPTMKAKAKYVVDQNLAGVMIWSIDQDAPGEKSLLGALTAELKLRNRTR